MSTPSIQFVRLAFLSLATVAAISDGVAQSTEPSDKWVAANQTKNVNACDDQVRPIQRTKKPGKPVSTDWTTMPSTYTHDTTGQRVDQYALAVEPQSNERADFVRSGFRHTRSTLQAGFSSDNYHVTEQWGQPVRPYGEWRYPNRPFSVPYGQWGPQLPQVVVGGNQWVMGGHGNPMQGPANPIGNGNGPGHHLPGNQFPGNQNPWNQNPWNQGPWNQGPWNQSNIGNGGAFGGFGVGPGNTLPAGQDEYYQQAPTYHPMSSDGFQSPFRN